MLSKLDNHQVLKLNEATGIDLDSLHHDSKVGQTVCVKYSSPATTAILQFKVSSLTAVDV